VDVDVSDMRGKTNRGRPKPPKMPRKQSFKTNSSNSLAVQFHAALLTSSVDEIAGSNNDETKMVELMYGICLRAGVSLPTKLPLMYNNSKDYFSMQASLVLEEARYILADILSGARSKEFEQGTLWMELVGMEAPKKKKVGFTLQFENRINGYGAPFNIEQLTSMKPGGVFEVSFSSAGTHDAAASYETVQINMLACITPGYYEVDSCRRSTLSLTVFPTQQLFLRQGTKWKVQYLTTLISEQRQFEACIQYPKINFIHTLLGWKTTSHNRHGHNDEDIGPKENEKIKHEDDSSAIESVFSIPKFNTMQEKTAVKFLQSPPSTVTLVQGPPGTGKTTFLASLLCRNLCEIRKDGSIKIDQKKRILVTAPTNRAILVIASKFLDYLKDSLTFNIVLIGVESKLISEDDGDDASKTQADPYTAASLSPSLRSIFVYTWLDEIISEYRSFNRYLLPHSYSPEKRRSLLSRASVLARRLHSSLPCIVEKTGSLYWAQEVVASLQRLPTNVSKDLNELTGQLNLTRECLTNFIDILDQINRFDANQELLDAANIIFCTLSTSGVSAMKRTKKIDDIFIDEAAAATEPEVLIPFHLRPDRMLAVGDPKQLPATLMSRYAIDCGLDRSLIGRLMFDCSHEYTMLDKQYRMRPEIRSLPSKMFYEGRIKDGDNVLSPDYRGKISILEGKPYSFLQVQGSEEKSAGHSYYNIKEAHAVIEIVRSICRVSKEINGDGTPWYTQDKVRIITFYKGQVLCIRQLLNNNGFGKVTCATVDSSQGCEADIVIISFVRSNHRIGMTHRAGFLQDERRINVALTRAKFQLICIGDAINTLSTSGVPVLKSIVDDAGKRGILSEFKSSSKSSAYNKPERKSNGNNSTPSKEHTGCVKKFKSSSNIISNYIEPEQKSMRDDSNPSNAPTNISTHAKKYTGYVIERRQRNNPGPSNNTSGYTKPEQRSMMNNSTPLNTSNSLSANATEYTGYVEELRLGSCSKSSNIGPNSIDPERISMGNHSNPFNSSTSTSAIEKEYAGHVGKSGFLTDSSSSNTELDCTMGNQNFPMNVSTSMSALTKEYTGCMKESKECQESYQGNQHNYVSPSTKNLNLRPPNFQDTQLGERSNVFQNDDYANEHQIETLKNARPTSHAEKELTKMALLEKIALLQKEVDEIDKL